MSDVGLTAEQKEAVRARHIERMRTDPAYRESKRASGRLAAAKKRKTKDPEKRRAERRAFHARKTATDSDYAKKRRDYAREFMKALRHRDESYAERQRAANKRHYRERMATEPGFLDRVNADSRKRHAQLSPQARQRRSQRMHEASVRRRAARADTCNAAEPHRMAAVYGIARFLTAVTGVVHEVDHVFPIVLGGPDISWNLRPVTRRENRAKHGRAPTSEEMAVVAVLHAAYHLASDPRRQ